MSMRRHVDDVMLHVKYASSFHTSYPFFPSLYPGYEHRRTLGYDDAYAEEVCSHLLCYVL